MGQATSCHVNRLNAAYSRPRTHKKGTSHDSKEAFLSFKKNNHLKMDLAFSGVMPCSICGDCELAPEGKEDTGKE